MTPKIPGCLALGVKPLERLQVLECVDAAPEPFIGLGREPLLLDETPKGLLDEFVAAGKVQVYYEDAIEALAKERPVRIERVGGTQWVEIDDHDDLARAREVIAPAIDAQTGAAAR